MKDEGSYKKIVKILILAVVMLAVVGVITFGFSDKDTVRDFGDAQQSVRHDIEVESDISGELEDILVDDLLVDDEVLLDFDEVFLGDEVLNDQLEDAVNQ